MKEIDIKISKGERELRRRMSGEEYPWE